MLAREGLHTGDWQCALLQEHAPCREPINVRCFCLRMPAHAADPVIEIIDGDEQDIGFGGVSRLGSSLSSEGSRAEAGEGES